jgi:peptidase YpeB-like protein
MKSSTLIAGLVAAIVIAPIARAQSPAQAPAKPKYSRDMPAKLVKEAKITESAAAEAALKAVPGGTIEKMELEKEDGKFIYSYDIKKPGKSGVEEVHVDAMTGAVISNVHEAPSDEKAKAGKDKENDKPAAAKPKKP